MPAPFPAPNPRRAARRWHRFPLKDDKIGTLGKSRTVLRERHCTPSRRVDASPSPPCIYGAGESRSQRSTPGVNSPTSAPWVTRRSFRGILPLICVVLCSVSPPRQALRAESRGHTGLCGELQPQVSGQCPARGRLRGARTGPQGNEMAKDNDLGFIAVL